MQRFINNWTATLTAPAATAAPELSIESVHAAKLVGLGTGDYYLLTLAKVVDEVEVNWEIVKVTAVSAGVLSVERAQEGTVALEWLVGEAVSARFTAAGAEALRESGGASVGDATPQPLGTATPGTSPQASRQDHRHALPTPAAIGAATSAQGALAATAVQPAALASGLDGKVDKVAGKGLSEEDFTAALRSKLVAIEPAAFRGVFASFAALLAGVTSPQPGDFADVDAGAGSDVVRYIWDATDSEWQAGAGGGGPASTDSLPEGATNLYFTVARVLASALTGLSVLTGGSVVSTDSVLAAFGKLQRQINDLTSALGGKQATLVSAENIKTINGASLLGSGDLTVGGVPLPAVQALSSSRSLTLADANTFNVNGGSAEYTLTIPGQSSVAWVAGTEIHFLRSGSGKITITAAAGVSLNGVAGGSVAMNAQHGAVTIKRVAADSWWLGGLTSSVQPLAANLTAFASLDGLADRLPYFTGVGTLSLATLTAAARTLLAAADVAAQRASLSVREQLSGNRTYYVRADGNDSNTGLLSSSSGAFLTIQKAIDTVAALDISTFSVTIQVGAGTFDSFVCKDPLGSGSVTIRGESSSTTTVERLATSGSAIDAGSASKTVVRDLKINAPNGTARCIYCGAGSSLTLLLVEFGSAGAHHIDASGGVVNIIGNYSVSGGGLTHWFASNTGTIICVSRTVTISGTPAFPSGWAYSDVASALRVNANTFVGTATGRRYYAGNLSLIFTNGGGASYLPGSTDGVLQPGTGAVYS